MQLQSSLPPTPATQTSLPLPSDNGRLTRQQYLVWALLVICVANFFNYMDRMLVSALEKQLVGDFQLAGWEFGLLWSLFTIGYMACAMPIGYLADHYNRTRLFAVCVVIWSAATVATGWAGRIPTILSAGQGTDEASGLLLAKLVLYVSRLFIGVGEAGCLVIGPALLSDYFRRDARGRALSAFYLGQPLGGTAGFVLVFLVFHVGFDWPWAFYVAGIPGFLIAACIWLLADPPRGANEGVGHHAPPGGGLRQYTRLLRNRSLLLIILAQTFSVIILIPLLHYGKKFLLDKIAATSPGAAEDALELKATLAMLAVMITGAAGMVVSGLVGDRLARRHRGAYALVAGVGFLLGWPCLFLGFRAEAFWVFLPALVAGCFFMFLCMPAVNTQIANVVHPSQRAAAWALAVFVLHLLGDTLAPPVFGKCIDWVGRQAAFEWFSGALLLASACCFLAARTAAADIARNVPGDTA